MNMARTGKKARLSAFVRLALIGSLLFGIVLLNAPASFAHQPAPDPGGFDVVQLPPEALTAPVVFPGASTGSAKMEGVLSDLATAAAASPVKALAQAEASQVRVLGQRLQVLITTSPDRADAATMAVETAGGEVTGRANGDTWLQAWAPIDALAAIAADQSVDYVSRPGEAITMATTEGAAVINAPAWNNAGFRGAGVKVAIIDGGFKGYPGLLGGDLSASVVVKNFVDGENDSQVNGTTEHGTACAEIVHDIAPDAALYLVKVGTNVDLEEAVNWVKTQGVNVISTSLGWYNLTPGDGTGFFANLVQSARSAGIFWTTAAGNDREAHWGGAFNGNASGYHQFSGTQTVDFFGPGDGNTAYSIAAGYPIRVYLRWDDWSAKNQDYDLYVVRWSGSAWQVVGSSETRQTGGSTQSPTEYVGVLTSGNSAPYGFMIRRYSSSRNVNLEVFAPKVARLDKLVTARSLANLADAPAAMTVAALDVKSPYPQESYSSEGPTNGAGGTASGGATKPDIAGFANVSTSSYPDPSKKFNGTSSATPHVAGAAALVKNANPTWSPAQIQSFLEGRAIDMGSAGKDTLFGWGRLNLGNPPQPNPPTGKKVFLPYLARSLNAPVLNGINNSGGQGNYTVSWSSVAGATSYILQEAAAWDFVGAVTVYSGANTSWQASNKAGGTYNYRVKAVGQWATSIWSNIQSTTVGNSSDWNILLNEGFEGAFPGPWTLARYGSYDWGKRSCRAATGSNSAWAVGGSSLSCGSSYPDYITTEMKYGPFSLEGATAAEMKFNRWNNTEGGYDWLCGMASVDGSNFYGRCFSGNSNGWVNTTLDLSNVYQIGDLRGRSQVWVAFFFDTDESNHTGEGAYVDDVVIRKCTTGLCPASADPAAAAAVDPSQVKEMAMPRAK